MLLLVVFFGLICSTAVSAAIQSIGVKGEVRSNAMLLNVHVGRVAAWLPSRRAHLMCGDQPLANADVNLWLLRTFPRPDTNLATVKTDAQGRFHVSGTDSSIFTIDPAVRFYHRCNNKGIFKIPESCQRESTYGIPKSYIAKSGKVKVMGKGKVDRWYEMGVMNMEDKQRGEQIHCTSNSTRAIRNDAHSTARTTSPCASHAVPAALQVTVNLASDGPETTPSSLT
ncbi:hypothetical protein PRIPAC_79536 [Pristionchus pacificus]|nr:hypothetical protein PRIPAC_79536 [Pristionchus pacificus]